MTSEIEYSNVFYKQKYELSEVECPDFSIQNQEHLFAKEAKIPFSKWGGDERISHIADCQARRAVQIAGPTQDVSSEGPEDPVLHT